MFGFGRSRHGNWQASLHSRRDRTRDDLFKLKHPLELSVVSVTWSTCSACLASPSFAFLAPFARSGVGAEHHSTASRGRVACVACQDGLRWRRSSARLRLEPIPKTLA